MISNLKRIIGNITVIQKANHVQISGIPANVIEKEMKKFWNTSRIGKYIFTNATRSSWKIPNFFVVELTYILRELAQSTSTLTGKRTFTTMLQEIKENTWLNEIVSDHRTQLNDRELRRFYKRPLDHQESFFEVYDQHTQKYDLNGFMLAAPPGAGKTLTGLMLAAQLEVDHVLVISPNNAVDRVWDKTFKEEYKDPIGPHITSRSNKDFSLDYYSMIVHYESIPRLLELTDDLKDKKIGIILDESHNLNDLKAARTRNFVKLCVESKADHVLWSSGTPVKAMGSEMIPFLKSIDRKFTDDVQERFKKIFGVSVANANDILAHRLGMSTYKIEKKKVVEGEPKEKDIYLTMENADDYTLPNIKEIMANYVKDRMEHYKKVRPEHKEIFDSAIEVYEEHIKTLKSEETRRKDKELGKYISLVKTFQKTTSLSQYSDQMKWANDFERNEIEPSLDNALKKKFRDSSSVIKYPHLKVQGEALGNVLGKKRTECHVDLAKVIPYVEILDSLESKAIIFTSFVKAADSAMETLTELSYNPLVVYGETNKELPTIVSKFEKDSRINPLVATYQSLSTAVPLIMANGAIFINQPFRYHEKDQAVSRMHRIGQEHQVWVFNTYLDTGDTPNVSTRSMDIMEWSKSQIESLMQDVSLQGSLESFDHEQNWMPDDIHEIILESYEYAFYNPEEIKLPVSKQDEISWMSW